MLSKKDVKLFDDTIHKAKKVATDLCKDMKELKEIIEELYQLYDDLSNDEGK